MHIPAPVPTLPALDEMTINNLLVKYAPLLNGPEFGKLRKDICAYIAEVRKETAIVSAVNPNNQLERIREENARLTRRINDARAAVQPFRNMSPTKYNESYAKGAADCASAVFDATALSTP